jgi:hypothetical protein
MKMMPVLFLCLIALVQKVTAQTYPVKKLYAYSQRITGGKSQMIGEPRRSSTIHHLYLEVYTGKQVTVTGLWITGKEFLFETTEAVSPVMMERSLQFRSKKDSVQLVPFTTNHLWQIKKLQPSTQLQKLPRHLNNYEVVIAYRYNNKTFYVGSKQSTVLQPVLRQ